MAELADAADSKSAEGNLVGVRPPLPAPNSKSYRTEPQIEKVKSVWATLILTVSDSDPRIFN